VGPETDNARLKVLEESNDGFYITEKDFEMRREGDLFGTKQSGDMSFKIADVQRDFKILMRAKADSEEFFEENIQNSFKNDEIYYKIINEIKSLD
jgi:ATP-dependent DNA helicase RecG